jgi:hypothetical protein
MLRNPVISPSGITFERDVITTWLSKSKKCPFTQTVLNITDLRSNLNLYKFIESELFRQRYNLKNPDQEIKFEEILK